MVVAITTVAAEFEINLRIEATTATQGIQTFCHIPMQVKPADLFLLKKLAIFIDIDVIRFRDWN